MATITVGVIKVVFTLISLSIVDRVGRRALLITGALGMGLSLIILSLSFNNNSNNYNTNNTNNNNNNSNDGSTNNLSGNQTNIALFAVCAAVASYSLGFGPVTWLVVSELFPDEIRGRTLGEWTSQRTITATTFSLSLLSSSF